MSRKSVGLVDDEEVWVSFWQVPEVNTLNVKTPKTQRKRRAERQSLGNLQESWTEETRKSQNKILLKSNSFVWKIFFWRSQKMIRSGTTVGTGWSNSTRSLDLPWRGSRRDVRGKLFWEQKVHWEQGYQTDWVFSLSTETIVIPHLGLLQGRLTCRGISVDILPELLITLSTGPNPSGVTSNSWISLVAITVS